jgi:hypothetical protein
MHRDDDSKYLLFVEYSPLQKSEIPIWDGWVDLLFRAISNATRGTSRYSDRDDVGTFSPGGGWRGVHHTPCGAASSNCEYLLENGMITNKLAPYYLLYYRDHILESDWKKLRALARELDATIDEKFQSVHYIGYYENLEVSGYKIFDSLEEAKSPWCFRHAIFMAPVSFTEKDLEAIAAPKYHTLKSRFWLVEQSRSFIHIKE